MIRPNLISDCPSIQSGCRQHDPFLPPFLLGDSRPLSQASWCHSMSPGRPSTTTGPTNQNSASISNCSRSETPMNNNGSTAKSSARKSYGAPPVKGLFDSLPPSSGTLPFSQENNSLQLYNSELLQGSNYQEASVGAGFDFVSKDKLKRVKSMSQLASPHDSFYMQGISDSYCKEEFDDETCITVFGFPANMESYIIQEFSLLGTIVKHLVPPEGNWLHIQYQNKYHARKALSKHGKLLLGKIMIGVQPCSDKAIILETDKENVQFLKKPTSGNTTGNIGHATSTAKPQNSLPIPSSVRPLAINSEDQDQNVPVQRRRSVVSNALGFIFGW